MKGWFRRRSQSGPGGEIETIIGPATTLVGELEVDGGLRIDGRFEGRLEVGGNVVIGQEGRVIADIDAGHVTVGGAVQGNIRATGRLEILSTGIVRGDILAEQVMIAPGGVLQGMSLMGDAAAPALSAPAEDSAGEQAVGRSSPDDPDPADAEDGAVVDAEAAPEPEDDEVIEAQLVDAEPPAGSEDAEASADEPADRQAKPADPADDAGRGRGKRAEAKRPGRGGNRGTGFAKPKAGGAKTAAGDADERESKTQSKPRGERRTGLGKGLDLNALEDIEPVIPDLSTPKAESKGDSSGGS